MDSTIKRIDKGQFWKFHGGIHPPEQKFITEDQPIRTLSLPKELILPLQQHIGQAGELIVSVGDKVLKGQPLTQSNHPMAVPIHAPTSGIVSQIKPSIIAHPSGLEELCIFLEPDSEEKWYKRSICTDVTTLNNKQLIEKIADAGISGMGGAGFPTYIKANTSSEIDYLIINAAECEPYITADDLLIREQSPTILDGINILHQIISPKLVLIGIEDNKPKAIQALQNATKNIAYIKVCIIPTKYPSGGEKQLIQILTGKEILSGSLPSSQGIVMQNIATCYAIADAIINDIPLIKRVTTVTGLGLSKPQNVWALLGTPISFLLQQCEYHTQDTEQVIMGGPMMGFSLPSGNVPVVKTTNCILAPSEKEISTKNEEIECIRCGQCAEVCPAQLLPQELQWSAKAKDHDQLNTLNLFDCIECGACAYVCPSHIPLVHYYRVGKAEIREQKQQEIKAEKAKIRFEARKARLERDKKAREEKQRLASEARKARMNSGTTDSNKEKSAVAAALARVKAKKTQTSTPEISSSPTKSSSQPNPQIAAAIARAKAKKLNAKQEPTIKTVDNKILPELINHSTIDTSQTTPFIDKKALVAAAIAKAKAKKLVSAQNKISPLKKDINKTTSHVVNEKNESAVVIKNNILNNENKKEKIAAAIAKAKAKKHAKTQEFKIENNNSKQPDIIPQRNQFSAKVSGDSKEKITESDNQKINITAAIAKNITSSKNNNDNEIKFENASVNIIKKEKIVPVAAKADDKKAKIAASIAKSRAKKNDEALTPVSIKDENKNRIAAAVAKAKAKKQQRSELN